jgi:cystathionine beta-lyase/cystathionine gamma-synthase
LRSLVYVGRHHGLTVTLDNATGTGLAFGPFDLGEGLGVGANDAEAVLRGLPSLAVPYDLSAMRQDRAHLPGTLVRLAIGLEAVADLQADLAQALAVLR